MSVNNRAQVVQEGARLCKTLVDKTNDKGGIPEGIDVMSMKMKGKQIQKIILMELSTGMNVIFFSCYDVSVVN